MPFTPVHLGFAIFIFSILPFVDPIALLIGTIIIDVEPIFYLITGIGQMHGIMHSTLGVMVFFIPTSFISWLCYKYLKLDRYLPKYNIYISLFSGILGLFSHIFFDAILYSEIMFFYPFSNTSGILYKPSSSFAIYLILGIMFLVGALILGVKYFLRYQQKKKKEEEEEKELQL